MLFRSQTEHALVIDGLYMLGVQVEPVDHKGVFSLAVEAVNTTPDLAGEVASGSRWVIDHKGQANLASLAWALPRHKVQALQREYKGHPAGSLVIEGDRGAFEKVAGKLHLDATAIDAPPAEALIEVDRPRIGLFHTWHYTQDSGWLRFTLEEYGVPYTLLDKDDLRAGKLRDKYDLSLLAGSGSPLRAAMDREGRVHALEIELAEGHLVQACRSGNELKVRNIEHAMRADVAVVALEVESKGLTGAIEAAGEYPELGSVVAEQLAWDVDFHTEARPGDRIQLIVEKRYLGPHFHRYGRVLGVRYIGAAGRVAYYRYKPEGQSGGFYDREGRPMKRELRRSPVAWYPVSRAERGTLAPRIEFVEGRMGAIYSRAAGAPVVALGTGRVTEIRDDAEDGLSLELEVGERRIRYMHLGRLFGDIEEGQELRQGQILGLVGNSGRAPTPRLRIELSQAGEIIDPMIVHNRGEGRAPRIGEPIPEKVRDRFAKDIRPWSRSLRRAGR